MTHDRKSVNLMMRNLDPHQSLKIMVREFRTGRRVWSEVGSHLWNGVDDATEEAVDGLDYNWKDL